LIVAVYVDDLFVTCTSLDIINESKKGMACKFDMSDLGKLTYYLGIKVKQRDEGISIKQESYARKILKETGMLECNPAHIPMEPGLKLEKDGEEPEVDATQYRRTVCCLRYLVHTRPDLAYMVRVP
jgi:hypothetical protein